MIRARCCDNVQIGAEESGAEFGDQLLDRIGLVPVALAELAIATGLGRSPVRQFMTQGGKGLPCGRCGSTAFHAASDNQNKLFAMTTSLSRLKSWQQYTIKINTLYGFST
jgi:hypothetical protein